MTGSKPTIVETMCRLLKARDSHWSRSLLNLDAWVIPRRKGSNHWTGAIIHFKTKQIIFADSLGSSDPQFCSRLWCLLSEVASQVLRKESFDFLGWSWGSLGLLAPQQPTGYDCGIFAVVLLVSA